MGNSYTRQSSFSDGDTINASLFNNEFDQLVAAFSNASGHTHDGTADEGGVITKVGPAQELTVSGTSVLPKTSNAIDLGSSTYKFKNAYFAGNITADGSITYNGNVVLGSDANDTVTINGTIQGGSLLFEGATADAHELTLAIPDATSDVTVTLPNATTTLVGKNTTDTLTNKTLSSPTISGNTTFSDGEYNFDIASHDGIYGLKLGGTLVTATADELNIIDGVTATTSELNTMDGITATTSELNIMDGVTATTSELNIMDGVTATADELNILDGVTATATELNLMDGVTATTTELNLMDGVTATTSELNILDGVTATTSDLNILDGVTATATELNILDGVTATADELNILDGVTATTTELNIMDGVTATTTELNLLDGITAIKDEDNMTSNSATSLATQQSIKAYVDAQVESEDTLAEMNDTSITSPADSHFLVHNGTNWVNESGATARTSLGVDESGTDNSTDVTLAGTRNYLTLSGQEITVGEIDISDDTNLAAGTGITLTGDSLSVDYGTVAGTAAQGNDTRLSDSRECNNSFDNAVTSRTNLGLGSAATSASTDFDAAGSAVAMAIALGG